MEDIFGVIGVLAWSENRWRGFDSKGYEHRQKYGPEFVKNTGIAHEWWNFYEDFNEKFYIGHIETKGKELTQFREGLVIFISRNLNDNKWYFVGFYGNGEYNPNQFATGKKLAKLIPENIKDDLKERLKRKEIQKYEDYVRSIFNVGAEYKGAFRGEKEYSTVFVPEGYVEITPDEIGVKGIGQMSFTYIDTDKEDKIRNLLLKAKQRHEELLQQVSEDNKDEINEIVRKIDFVLEYYFEGGIVNKEELKIVLLAGKEKYGEYWKENSEKVLQVYREFVDRVIDGEDPRVLESELQDKYKETLNKYKDINKLFWYIFGVSGAVKTLDDRGVEKFREFIKAMKNVKSEDEAWNVFEQYKNAIKGLKTVSLSTWASILHPEKFIPLWWGRDQGIININNLAILGLDKMMSKGTLPLEALYNVYPKLAKEIKDVSAELGIHNLLEIAFYLSKYRSELAEFLNELGNTFLETANRENLEVTPDQLKPTLTYYRKLYLPPTLSEHISGRVHFEWVFSKSYGLGVGLHIEFNDRNKNDEFYRYIASKVDLNELAEKLEGELYNSENQRTWRWIQINKKYTDLNDELKKWAANTMVELYKRLTPLIEEYVESSGTEAGDKTDKHLEEMEKKIEAILNYKGQVILYGPPGTGKTWLARNYIRDKTKDNRELYESVTFHPSYSYEEFVEGIRPITNNDGNIYYEIEDGIFKQICRKAYNAILDRAGIDRNKRWGKEGVPELTDDEKERIQSILKTEDYPKFYLIIDEINRGDISKIFGELITLLEADKRLFAENEIVVTLPYSKTRFGIPPNLYIIGTMNTADRSIALIDVALRRRFGFIEMMPSYKVLLKELGIAEDIENEEKAVEILKGWGKNELKGDIKKLAVRVLYALNQKIQLIYDRDHQIGHSYFLKLKDGSIETLREIWYHEIIPLLQEYFYNDWGRLKYLLRDFLVEEERKEFVDSDLGLDDEDAKVYRIEELDGEDFLKAMLSVVEAKSSQSAE